VMSPLLIAILAVVLVLGGVLVLVLAGMSPGGRKQERLAQMTAQRQAGPTIATQRVFAGSMDRAPAITNMMRGTQLWTSMQFEILRAGWLLRPSELVALMLAGALGGFAVGLFVLRASWGGFILAPLGLALPWMMMKVRQGRRQKGLSAQLPDAIDMLSSALRAGFAFMRGLQLIQSQMHPPISEEVRRVTDEVQLGVSIEEALDNLTKRTGNYDLELLAAAVQTQLQLGGNLSEVLENIGETIRERVRLSAELSAATAEGRLSASILLAMPFGMAFLINFINPGYLKPLFSTTLGFMIMGAAVGLLSIGALVIKKLVTVEV
jgi:tight adherence protein B